jgi:hypothetical protein
MSNMKGKDPVGGSTASPQKRFLEYAEIGHGRFSSVVRLHRDFLPPPPAPPPPPPFFLLTYSSKETGKRH